jgi:hypothetical protein
MLLKSTTALAFSVLAVLPPAAEAGARQATTAPARAARQAPAPDSTAAQTVVPVQVAVDANETREQLRSLLRQYPPSVNQVFRIDPSMLTNEHYLATYPALAAFLASHPEVAHNPAYFVGTTQGNDWFDGPPESAAVGVWRNIVDGLEICTVVITITLALVWLVKMLLDYRRWLRMSRVQTEAHTKLLDRFGSNQELLAYIETPAGRRFLEAAPMPVSPEPFRAVHAPLGRILWSVQVGVVLVAGGAGLLFVSARQIPEIGQPLWAIGSLGVALGLGFVVSALISYLLSWRLGLLKVPAGSSRPDPSDAPA